MVEVMSVGSGIDCNSSSCWKEMKRRKKLVK